MKPRFKKDDIVIVTDDCIRERKAFTAGAVTTFFDRGKKYKVIDVGLYGGTSADHFRVLVEGSTQFTHEDYFEFAEKKSSKLIRAGEENQSGFIFKIDLQKIDRYPVDGRIEKIYSEVMNTRININKLCEEYDNLNRTREKVATIADEYLKISALSNVFTTTELRKILISGIETKMTQLEVDVEVMKKYFNDVIKETNK